MQKKPKPSVPYPAYSPYDSNRGWHGEWFYIRNLVEVPFPMFTEKRPERRESWSWGPTRQQNKLEIIETELRRLVQHGRWVVGLPYLLPLSGRPIGRENTADVGIL